MGVLCVEVPSRDTTEVFKRLGLTKYESSVLLALVANQGSTLDYKDLLSATDVPYGRIHSILVDLEEKGMVRSMGGRPKRYISKPIGEIIEDYILTPVLENLLENQVDVDKQFRDVWIKQVSSLVPVIYLDESGGEPRIEFIRGIDELRTKEYDEAQRARKSLRLCIPTSGFLDRKRSASIRIADEVDTEIVTSVQPRFFLQHMAPEERTRWHRTIAGRGDIGHTRYYVLPRLNERMVIVDERFASIGTSVIPVTAHIHSGKICGTLVERFEMLKKEARLVEIREGSYS